MRHKQKVKNRKWKVKSLGVATLLTCAFSLSSATAQTSVNTTGGNASGSGGSESYSVGQVVYTIHSGTNGTVAEGVQQPYEISVVTAIEEAKDIDLSVTAYPNPATDYLILKVDASTTLSIQSLSFQLYDMQGKLLQNKKLTGTETQIDMSNLMPSTYFVKVISGGKSIKVFKIIKK